MTVHMGANATVIVKETNQNNIQMVTVSNLKEDPVLLGALVDFSEAIRLRLKTAYRQVEGIDLLGLAPDFDFDIVSVNTPDTEGLV